MEDKMVLEKGTVIFKEGEPATKLFLIKKGEILCLKTYKDRLIPVFRAKKDDIVGEAAMIENSVYDYSAVSNGLVDMVEIPASNFSKVLKDSPPWLLDLTSTMINRFKNTSNLIAENRIVHSSIIKEEDFPNTMEVEYKKLLSNKTE